MKLPKETIEEILPEKEIKDAFLRREDIAKLSPQIQEEMWTKALPNIRKFLGFLSTLDTLAVMNDKGQILI